MAKSQIIKELANSTVDTYTALKRTKVLLQNLDNETAFRWVNYELEGYPDDEEVPAYRKVTGQLYGTYIKGSLSSYITYKHVSLPLGHMPSDDQELLLNANITQDIKTLQVMMSKNKENGGGTLAKTIPADFFPYIAKYNDDPYMMITSASVEFSELQIREIFSKVENKLLDILLYLEKQFGNLDELDIDISDKNEDELKEINQYIQILISNDHSITIGDDNVIKTSNIDS